MFWIFSRLTRVFDRLFNSLSEYTEIVKLTEFTKRKKLLLVGFELKTFGSKDIILTVRFSAL